MATIPDMDGPVFSKLAGNSALTTLLGGTAIYSMVAPTGRALPYVIFYMAVGDIPNRAPRDEMDTLYRIESRANIRGSAAAIHTAVYAAIHEQTLTVSGWTNYTTEADREQRFHELVNAVEYYRFVWDVRIRSSQN